MKRLIKSPFATLLMLAGLCLNPVYAAAKEIPFPQCPQKLSIQQNNKSNVDHKWKVVDSIKDHYLRGVYFSYGEYPIQQTGFLIASEEKKQPDALTIYYDYVSSDTGDDYGHWAACHYSNSLVVLVQKLPEKVVRCEVKRLNDVLAPDRITVKCFDTPRK